MGQGFDETFLDVTDLVDRELERMTGTSSSDGPDFVGHLYESPLPAAAMRGGGGRR